MILELRKNGIRYSLLGRGTITGPNFGGFGGADIVDLAVDDYLELAGYQTFGSSKEMTTTEFYQRFSARKIAFS